MKITALVENQTKSELKAKHGLSLYIETQKHKILFDLGPDNTLFDNAKTRGIDLSKVDTVIISHGHIDHGGALSRFLQINSIAKIYVQRKAFEPHYSKSIFLKVSIGIDDNLKNHPQVVLVEGDCQINDELSLFTVSHTDKCYSKANDALYTKGQKDDFLHEHNLIIREKQTALIMGCGHAGIVNIMEKAESYHPQLCIGGYHLFNPLTKKTVSTTLLNDIAQELQKYPQIQFYTCHCTGIEAFRCLSQQISNLFYLLCGDIIEA
ncbi:MAG TPA: MBL fold metallo-hydrolase [Desulfitobacterium dehalogenans]|uniref:MBL fold metallo-hydrolase n=1 Tax=Desulfitobacterium dehalogenans TaxID=36854 RepID=A0A7C6Z788_9FIRM|nr:MBL fold metallo-hydrolase [Desulfitobacterium dehalogenans]